MAKDVAEYRDAVADERHALFGQVEALILDLYPDAQVSIWYNLPSYNVKSGWVGLGYWKNGVSFYTNHPEHIASFKRQHPRIKTNTSSINLRATVELPTAALQEVIRHAMENPQPSAE